MRRPAALFPIVLALGAIIFAPRSAARAQDAREEGPREIEKCQTIDKPGSYKLVNDLTFSATTGACLTITADFVTIDLAGFTITGPVLENSFVPHPTAIEAVPPSGGQLVGIVVRNGSISNFAIGVELFSTDGSIVEGLRVIGNSVSGPLCPFCLTGIDANGIVRRNTVVGFHGSPGEGVGISATGIVTGNYVTGSRAAGMQIGQGSTVIGNTVLKTSPAPDMFVTCPSNVTDNTTRAIVLIGTGCNTTNNVGVVSP